MNIAIGEKIRKLRRDKNLTQEEVASHLGISFQSVSKWERGDGYPDITLLPVLANYFGVTTDHIYFGGEIPPAQEKAEAAPISLFPDDGVLRVVQFMGGVMLSAEEAGAGEVIELSLGEYNAHEYTGRTEAEGDFAVLYNASKRKYALPASVPAEAK